LQVAQLIDATASENKDALSGVRQLLEKKEGLFRMNMMGKRVNFAARSVISPDPYLGTGEIGVPPFFAQRLSFPEIVTQHNVEWLRQLVRNGPGTYPGAVAVEDMSDGRVVLLHTRNEWQREGLARTLLHASLAKGEVAKTQARRGKAARSAPLAPGWAGKCVYRHLQDGDVMLTNRQPTLHKPGARAR
jgi:DNA-directed RNA polymerase I subunit RPA1